MTRWFLSYNSQDLVLANRLEAALLQKEPHSEVFLAPKSLHAGSYWLPELAKRISDATAFILLIGEKGLGPWQFIEYCEALDRRVSQSNFPIVLILIKDCPAPGLPFLRQLHWIPTSDPASEQCITQLLDALSENTTRPSELWRFTAPYRGLASMTESDADFFFGRSDEIVATIEALQTTPNLLCILLGNSGVGKSSLAQAGVIASLVRQQWPESIAKTKSWPPALKNSRQWIFVKFRPGAEPVRELVRTFLSLWDIEPTSPLWALRLSEWTVGLLSGQLKLSDLLDATERQQQLLGRPPPPAFLVSIDQGEELYIRPSDSERRQFSRIISEALIDPRFMAMMSLRSDFFGELQKDEALFASHRQLNVPPLRELALRDVVSRPARLLSARFDSEFLAADLARRAAEESTKDAGALPLLAYTLDSMWMHMRQRGDGILRLPPNALELGGVLVENANDFLANNPNSADVLRRIFTLKLATVLEDGQPTRRRAPRSEFSEDEWRLVSRLADYPHRLLATVVPEVGEAFAEVAHEAIFRRWETLSQWISDEREFLIWKTGLDLARRTWKTAPHHLQGGALLMGLSLVQAQNWLAQRPEDISKEDRAFIGLSTDREVSRQQEIVTAAQRLAEEQRARADLAEALAREEKEKAKTAALLADTQVHKTRYALIGILVSIALLLVTGLVAYFWYGSFQSATRAEGRAQKLANDALFNQSLYLAQSSREQSDEGNLETALLLAREALPRDIVKPERPIVREAASALSRSLFQARSLSAFKGLDTAILSFAIPKSESWILVGGADGTLSVRSLSTEAMGKEIVALSRQLGPIAAVDIDGNDANVVVASADGRVSFWRADEWKEPFKTIQIAEKPTWMKFDPTGKLAVVGTVAGKIVILPVDDAQTVLEPSHAQSITAADFDKVNQRLVTASRDGLIQIWDLNSRRLLNKITVSNSEVWDVKFNGSGDQIGTASADGKLRLFDTQRLVREYSVGNSSIQRLEFNDQGDQLITSLANGDVLRWNLRDGSSEKLPIKNGGSLHFIAFNRERRLLAIAAIDGGMQIWESGSGAIRSSPGRQSGSLLDMSFLPSTDRIISIADDGSLLLRDVNYVPVSEIRGQSAFGLVGAFSPKADFFVSASADGLVESRDVVAKGVSATHALSASDPVIDVTFPSCANGPITVSMSSGIRVWNSAALGQSKLYRSTFLLSKSFVDPQCKVVLAILADGRIEQRAFETGELVRTLEGHSTEITWGAFSRDGNLFATVDATGIAKIWRVSDGSKLADKQVETDRIVGFDLSEQGILTIAQSGSLKVSRLPDLQVVAEVQSSKPIASFATGSDHTSFIVGHFDGHVSIWKLANLDRVTGWQAHARMVTSVALDSDSNLAVTGAADRTAAFWDASTGELYGRIKQQDTVTQIAISTDRKFVSLNASGLQISLARGIGSLAEQLKEAESFVSRRELTPEERQRFSIVKMD